MCPWPFTQGRCQAPVWPSEALVDTCWLPMMFSSWAPNLCVYVLPEAPEATCLHPSTPTLPRPRSWGRHHGASREVPAAWARAVPGEKVPCHTQKHLHAPAPTPARDLHSSCLGQGHRKPVWGLFLPCASGQGCPSLSAFSRRVPSQLFSISLENSLLRKNRLAECVCVWPVH